MNQHALNRWAWAEINVGALKRNARAYKKLIGKNTKLMAVVKADAYGHGAIECARALYAAGAEQFGVATVDEGIALRASGITSPILVLAEPPVDAVADLVEYNLMPAVYTIEFALAFGEAAANADKMGYYHLAIDTGMTRIGVLPSEACALRETLDFHRGLSCAGTFTHFATADSPKNWDFELQLDHFVKTIEELEQAGFDCGLIHCDNTGGTMLHPEAHFDMVRVGIGLYGLQPSEFSARVMELEPVMSVKARVTRVLDNPEVGTGVSYGLTYRVPKVNIQIATIPLGYADGLSRTLSGKIDVLCNGVRHHQVGTICMDQCMFAVDVNMHRAYHPVAPVTFGDTVTIVGTDGEQTISLDEIAQLEGTINYEVACDFGMRLPKVYTGMSWSS